MTTKADEVLKKAKSLYKRCVAMVDIETLVRVYATNYGLNADDLMTEFREWIEHNKRIPYSSRNPERARAYQKEYYHQYRDEIRARRNKQRAENRDEVNRKHREWEKANPEKIAIYKERAKAKRLAKKAEKGEL